MVFATQHVRQAKERRRVVCEAEGSLKFCDVWRLPVVEDNSHEASGASTDVHEAVVLPFQATMAGYHSEPVGFPSQLSALVLSQDLQLLRSELFFALG